MVIKELTAYTADDIAALDALMHELSPSSSCDEQTLQRIVGDKNAHLYIITDETRIASDEGRCVSDKARIIGSACLCVAHTTEQTLGFVESVVVSGKYRGQHLGEQLVHHLVAEARRMGIDSLHLTSKPARVAANALYQKLGFVRHETNVYKMALKV